MPSSKTRKPSNYSALASHSHYADHEVSIATRGPTAGQPKRVRPDPRRQLTDHQIENAHQAFLFAQHKGWRLNTWVTVIFDQLHGDTGWHPGEPPGPQVQHQRRRLTKSLESWCRQEDIPLAWIMVIENVPGRGPHAHLLIALPEDAPYKTVLPLGVTDRLPDARWTRYRSRLCQRLKVFCKWTRSELDAAIPDHRPFDVSLNHLPTLDAGVHDSALTKLRYAVKAASPDMVIIDGGTRATALELVGEKSKPALTLKPSSDTYTPRMLSVSGTLSTKARREDRSWVEPAFDPSWISHGREREQFREHAIERIRESLSKKPSTNSTGPT